MNLDIQDTKLPDCSYDLIICNHVLEHVDDYQKALEEMYRILRPGEHFICSFPIDERYDILEEDNTLRTAEERIQKFGQADHNRVFGINADTLLIQAGFTVHRIQGESYPDEILPVTGPADYDINYLFDCVKPS